MKADPEILVIRTFLTRIEAEIAQVTLEAASIESMLAADDAGGLRPGLAGTRLLVRAEDVERAAEVLGPMQ
jgi:hypothetical protein